jgi:hypothetical protein
MSPGDDRCLDIADRKLNLIPLGLNFQCEVVSTTAALFSYRTTPVCIWVFFLHGKEGKSFFFYVTHIALFVASINTTKLMQPQGLWSAAPAVLIPLFPRALKLSAISCSLSPALCVSAYLTCLSLVCNFVALVGY